MGILAVPTRKVGRREDRHRRPTATAGWCSWSAGSSPPRAQALSSPTPVWDAGRQVALSGQQESTSENGQGSCSLGGGGQGS